MYDEARLTRVGKTTGRWPFYELYLGRTRIAYLGVHKLRRGRGGNGWVVTLPPLKQFPLAQTEFNGMGAQDEAERWAMTQHRNRMGKINAARRAAYREGKGR